jgi:erythromycin esterase
MLIHCVRALICLFPLMSVAAPLRLQAEDAVGWAKSHAVSIGSAGDTDLSALKSIVGDARLVGFGEAIHRGHEFLILRNEVFKYLVEQQGFTAIATESGYAASLKVDDYVLGRGQLTDDVVAAVFSFTAPTAYAENRSLIEWMRSYNARPGVKRKIRFYGLEPVAQASGQAFIRDEVELALDYLAVLDPEQAPRFAARLTPVIEATVRHGYENLTQEQRDAYTVALADLVGLFERHHVQWAARSSSLDYQRAYRNALNARALDADLRNFGWWISRHGDRNQRDASSAQLAEWVLSQEGPKGRVMLFAHNLHLRKGPVSKPARKFTSMGQHLHETQGTNLVVIGSAYQSMRGAFEKARGNSQETAVDSMPDESVGAVLSQVPMQRFVVDLRAGAMADAGAQWWGSPRNFHGAGEDHMVLTPRDCFDALIFTRDVTPARDGEEKK